MVCFIVLFNWVGLQAQNPGGVSGHVTWVKPSSVENSKSLIINHNAVEAFNESQKTILLSADKSLLSGVTFFCVSLSDTLKERALWSIGNDSATNVVMTNRRMAGLDDYNYINFQTKLSAIPQISTYCRKRALTDTLNTKTLLKIGTIGKDKIPVNDFKGALPEYVLYNRVLSFQERLRVESYLALKYGISLNQTYPTSYLSSQGKVIWDAEKFAAYSGSIAGIGRDVASGLQQLKSGSSKTPQMLEIEVVELADQDFLIWGDNQQPLTFVRKRGEITKLQRGWMAVVSGHANEKSSSLSFSTAWLQEMHPLADDEIYWLAIDDSGKGTYEIGLTRFFASDSKSTNTLQFNHIKWDLNNNGHDNFTLVAAPELFATIHLSSPNCKNKQLGALAAELVGGVAPFQVQLIKEGEVVASRKAEHRLYAFSELAQGSYQLLINDSQNRTYKQAFIMANSDMEQLVDFEPFVLKSGSSVLLDGSKGLGSPSNYFFDWQNPHGESVKSQFLAANEAGLYLLKVTNGEGCSTLREAEVRMLPDKFLKYVQISPNPAVQKVASLKVQLVQAGTIMVSITSPKGQLVSNEKFSGADYYSITCQFPEKGIWLITIEGNGEKKTMKVLADFN